MIEPIRWTDDGIQILDQTVLPDNVTYITCQDYHDVVKAIQTMKIRGAPAIGIAAAMGVSLGAKGIRSATPDVFYKAFDRICKIFLTARPTAVNLAWAVKRMQAAAHGTGGISVDEIKERLEAEARHMLQEDIRINRRIGSYGKDLIQEGQTILTHCNAGALATGGYGTALGVIRAAWDAGKGIDVIVDETRPRLQGARLTTWELLREGIPFKLITDNMAGDCMRKGMVDMVLVGADRITANGDVANKIGTYTLAVLARTHDIPFYVAAPLSTIDFDLTSGVEIPIEERDPKEVTHIGKYRI